LGDRAIRTPGANQHIAIGSNRIERVGAHAATLGLTGATLTITKPADAEDSQFFTAFGPAGMAGELQQSTMDSRTSIGSLK
jgi:hypothetical protein